MTDEPAPVVPIRDSVQVQQDRSVELLEFVTQSMARFEAEREDQPVAIAFVIYGEDGKTKTAWMNGSEIGELALCALAGALLLGIAVNPEGRD